MSTVNFGDSSTVYGDRTIVNEDHDATLRHKEDFSPIKEYEGSKRAGKAKASQFVTADYELEDRPFFIPIGKDGLVAALQKLDKQLVDVSPQCS